MGWILAHRQTCSLAPEKPLGMCRASCDWYLKSRRKEIEKLERRYKHEGLVSQIFSDRKICSGKIKSGGSVSLNMISISLGGLPLNRHRLEARSKASRG